MGYRQKWSWYVSDLLILMLMVLSFLLFLIVLITEMKARFVLSDVSLMLIVMVTVSVVPAIGKLVHSWMIAEKEPDIHLQTVYREKRTRLFVFASTAWILILSVRLGVVYLGR